MLVGETVKTRKGQKTLTYSNGTKASITHQTHDMLIRIYHCDLDAIREQDLLKRLGVAPENIITRKYSEFVTIENPTTHTIAQCIQAIPEEQGGSGYVFTIEVRGVTPEQVKAIVDAEIDMETPCFSTVHFRLRGRMRSESNVLATVIEYPKGYTDYIVSQMVKDYVAEEQGVSVDEVELCGVWGEKEKKEAVTQ